MNWLIGLLRDGSKKADIFLTHHQPVSAHAQEFANSAPLRAEIEESLKMPGIALDAIFAGSLRMSIGTRSTTTKPQRTTHG